ncbi:MAG: nucleotidyl transferase AbiEii/AbiGii toxin family protein [Bacteroidales bacterium]|nr:nucleotidyl transferase AbiEii/AbiGii toxin family protein [Bacteroidales bacterium]
MDNDLLWIRIIITTRDNFSEDIDLVVIRSPEENDNQLKKKIKTITKVVSDRLPEINIDGITQKMGMNRKTAHSYPKAFKGDYGQVRDLVIVEATWLGYFEPYTNSTINSFIYDMMLKTGQQQMAEEFGLTPFKVQVLDARRTLCEKIMSLVRFSYGDNPIDELKSKVRHTYDLHQLLKQEDIFTFFNSSEFERMFLKVAQDDVESYRNNNEWLRHHPNKAIIFSELEYTWQKLKETYTSSFRNMVYGTLPAEGLILATLIQIKERLSKISWEVKFKTFPKKY